MKYFFILGTNPTLSIAELAAVFKSGELSLPQKNIALLETEQEISSDILEHIGGTVKFGLIHNELISNQTQDIIKTFAAFTPSVKLAGKFNFGISFYGKAGINQKALAMEFKKLLKQADINSRWVISREATLSSVVVEQNKLTTDKGVEIVIIPFNKKFLLGRTLAVQPFKQLSFRDYGRPWRDDLSGMLPPKLAQIMLNFSGAERDSLILDPFCGSGTILTEAMLMGFKNIIGSDVSNKALRDTKTNIAWTKKNFQFSIFNFQLINSSSTRLSKRLAPHSVDAIITEPYLGPQRGKIDLEKVKRELEKLYSDSLCEFAKILKPSGRIVMVWPVFHNLSLRGAQRRSNLTDALLNPNLGNFRIINPLPTDLQKNIFLKLTSRQTIVYGRENQKVWREIVILEK